MKLTIKQNNTPEAVTSSLIDKLYDLSFNEDALTQDSVLEGYLSTSIAYEDAVSYLQERFSGLTINALNYYIRFADPNVLSVLLRAGLGDGVGITTSQAATANISTTFENNTVIVSFDEFKYFTSQQVRVTSFIRCYSLERIDISDCTNIGRDMFRWCSRLSYFHGANSVKGALTIPNGISSIGEYAFQSCMGITTLTLHGNINIIQDAFYGCSNLNAICIDSLADWLSITFNDQPLQLAHNLYINGSLVQNVTIPSGTDLTNKFYGSTSLTSVTIEDGVTSIGNYAFRDCTSLVSVSIPSSVTSIGVNVFYKCTSLSSVNIPSSVTNVGNSAFEDCYSLEITDLNLPNLTSLGSYAFMSTKVQTISNLGSITNIPYACFMYCSQLTSITIPNSVTSIAGYAFLNCVNLVISDLNLPNLTLLGDNAFVDVKVQTISNLGSITNIPNACFRHCPQLTSITIPNSVTSIGADAFRYSTSLISVTILATTPPTLGSGVFYDNALGRKIYVPSESVNAYKAASGWSTYAADIEAIPTT